MTRFVACSVARSVARSVAHLGANMRFLTSCVLAFLLTARLGCAADASSAEALYRNGILPSGAPLIGQRLAGASVKGADAACVNCHRRSGFGTAEGQIIVPPITGHYLFRPASSTNDDMDYRYMPGYVNLKRQPFTDQTLPEAIRHGTGRDGRPLNELMPRFDIDDETMTQLIGYLRGLSSTLSPGVTEDTLHFATITTPDSDRTSKDGMLAVMRQFFSDQNEYLHGGVKPMQSDRNVFYRVKRRWQLHVWELSGPPETWERQLHEHLASEPVFAVISGIGGRTWAPVHRFCESEALPCLFPNVDVPVIAEHDFYNVYFSKGVLLEAELISARLALPQSTAQVHGKSSADRRVIQVFQRGDAGEEAAAHLAAQLAATGKPAPFDRPLDSDATPGAINQALTGIKEDDVLILWLRPGALASLPSSAPRATVYASGLMGGLEHAPLPVAWRESTVVTYPVDLPVLRRVAMNFPLAWFNIRHVPILDERVEANTYLACQILADALSGMLDLFHRDYLVEQLENMLSRRLVNGYFPRLSLAPTQRFASKGGYFIKLSGSTSDVVSPQGSWVVP
jgi:hypothetical protein